MNRHPNEAKTELKNALAEKGVRGALVFLNSLSPHRFTSLYRFDDTVLHNITFYDRKNPTVNSSEDIPVEASYCVFVRDLKEKFTVRESRSDERVKDHAKRETVQRYCGVPLLDRRGEMFGTICHFDFEPGRVDERDVELLEYMAQLLQGRVEEMK